MLYTLISPAKKLATNANYTGHTTQIPFKKETAELVKRLQEKTPAQMASFLHLSEKLAYLNYTRYQTFNLSHYASNNALPALFMFQGDVCQGLEAKTFSPSDLEFCQQSLGILSGLYGLLSPLDLIQPYRLEMGTKLANCNGDKLIDFWQSKITKLINKRLSAHKANYVINLASQEYFSAVKQTVITQPIIKIDFKETKQGQLKTIGIYAKRARGTMVQFMVKQRCKTLADLKAFTGMGYQFNPSLSSATTLTCVR